MGDNDFDSPSNPSSSADENPSSSNGNGLGSPQPPKMSPRSISEMPASTTLNMTASSTPLGNLNAARRPGGAAPRGVPSAMNPDIAAKMKAFSLSRAAPAPRQAPTLNGGMSLNNPMSPPSQPAAPAPSTPGPAMGGIPAGFKMPPNLNLNRPVPHLTSSSPAIPGKGPSLAEKRGLKLPGGLPGAAPAAPAAGPGRQKPKMSLSSMGGGAPPPANGGQPAPEKPKELSEMEKYAEFIDTKTGALKFKGKAVIHGGGIDFSSGRSFNISLDEVDTLDEMGKGNYGTVYKVRHSRPKMRRPGQGLAGNKSRGPGADEVSLEEVVPPTSAANKNTTGIVMAMKEIRLELDEAKFGQIIMELDILHRCVSPCIVDFYGAFFQEGAVYICMEFMDGGSVDKIYGDGVPEGVLRKITLATTQGLKSLKEEHNIIHRDVKPTNILVNTKGHVKICDFGVSGNLVASIAKTNIGCQSYMAPERISGGGMAQAGAVSMGTYSVQSDIWSLGLSIIECALGRYPYPPETYDNIFSQLQAIVDGDPPDLPPDNFSEAAHDFVAGCLNKIPKLRPTYPMLLQHAWLAPLLKPDTISEEDEEAAERGEDLPTTDSSEADGGFFDKEVGQWVIDALERRRTGKMNQSIKPALHAAPLDGVQSPKPEVKPVAVDA